jgi:hypothetical protein
MGKGSAPRPFADREEFDKNFDLIFGKKKNGNKPNSIDSEKITERELPIISSSGEME